MRKLTAALLLALTLATPAAAQVQVPQTLPASSVWGRTGIGSGPGQAVPFSILSANLFLGLPAHGVVISEGSGTPPTSVAPGATGLPLVSNGASADPGYAALTAAGIAAATITGTQIASNTVANSNLATVPPSTVKGSIAGGAPSDLTTTQLTTLCNAATASLSGCVPAWPNNTTTFFRGDGTYNTPPTVTSGAPGYVPAFPNNTTTFFRGDGTYSAPPTAGMTLLNTLTASNSATLSDTTSLTSSFKTYMVVLTDIIPVANAVSLQVVVSTNGGSSYLNTGYLSVAFGIVAAGTGQSTSTTGILINHTGQTIGNGAGEGLSGVLYIANPSGGGNRTHFSGQTVYNIATSVGLAIIGGWQDGGNTAVNAIQFAMSSGNISSGTIKIYGIP